MRDLPRTLRAEVPDVRRATLTLTRALAMRAVVTIGGRITRLLPGLGAGLGLVAARRRVREQGERMARFYRNSWVGGLRVDGPIEDAHEVG